MVAGKSSTAEKIPSENPKEADDLRESLGLDDTGAGNTAQTEGGESKPRKRLAKKSHSSDEEDGGTEQGGKGAEVDDFIAEEVEGRGEDLDDFIVDDERAEYCKKPSLSYPPIFQLSTALPTSFCPAGCPNAKALPAGLNPSGPEETLSR